MNRRLLAALAILALTAGCSPKDHAGGEGAYAGLDPAILAWRGSLEASHPACAVKTEGRGCESFQITCKAAQEITSQERSAGVTAQLVAAMTFNGRKPDGSTGNPGSAFALFSKTGGVWSRAEASPVNLSSCAPI